MMNHECLSAIAVLKCSVMNGLCVPLLSKNIGGPNLTLNNNNVLQLTGENTVSQYRTQ